VHAERLDQIGAARSVGSKGDSYDNAAAESLNSLYKKEFIDYRGGWENATDVTLATMEWVAWYNAERLHFFAGTFLRLSASGRSTLRPLTLGQRSRTKSIGLQHRRGGPVSIRNRVRLIPPRNADSGSRWNSIEPA
jgi:transposase InsO family protein